MNKKSMKKVIRLTENDLHRIVKNSVKKILKESYYGMSLGDILRVRKAQEKIKMAKMKVIMSKK